VPPDAVSDRQSSPRSGTDRGRRRRPTFPREGNVGDAQAGKPGSERWSCRAREEHRGHRKNRPAHAAPDVLSRHGALLPSGSGGAGPPGAPSAGGRSRLLVRHPTGWAARYTTSGRFLNLGPKWYEGHAPRCAADRRTARTPISDRGEGCHVDPELHCERPPTGVVQGATHRKQPSTPDWSNAASGALIMISDTSGWARTGSSRRSSAPQPGNR
jgi:hypothetical protein